MNSCQIFFLWNQPRKVSMSIFWFDKAHYVEHVVMAFLPTIFLYIYFHFNLLSISIFPPSQVPCRAFSKLHFTILPSHFLQCTSIYFLSLTRNHKGVSSHLTLYTHLSWHSTFIFPWRKPKKCTGHASTLHFTLQSQSPLHSLFIALSWKTEKSLFSFKTHKNILFSPSLIIQPSHLESILISLRFHWQPATWAVGVTNNLSSLTSKHFRRVQYNKKRRTV